MVEMTKDSKKAYRIFSWLREKLPNANVCTLRHVSVYIAKTNEEFDVNNDLQLVISAKKDTCKLLLSSGVEIKFSVGDNENKLDFVVEKNDNDTYMTMFVTTHDVHDLSTAYVHGVIVKDDFEYLVSTDAVTSGEDYFIKVYYNGKQQSEATSYFKATIEDDISLDCIDGLGHLTSVMTRIDLLFNNLKSIKNNKLARKR